MFSWTDEWHVSYLSENGDGNGSVEMRDWDFGLTDREREPKPALTAVRRAFRDTPFEADRHWPRVSVVVCTCNGARTLERCLEELDHLDYPDFEVIVVDDGSTDASADIAAGTRAGSSRPRTAASRAHATPACVAASGEIVAYLDDDAHPDPHWLRYLVATIEDGDFAGAGGPNLPPEDDGPVARCVAEAPGGPIHVLLSDREAEHLPGCNMAFRRTALERLGGFDPQFHVAGDDVDICWRLLDAGHRLGFSPAAVVWHSRRPSVRAYLRQQRGYGAAEALLERKWPQRYGPTGQARWRGRLYGRGLVSGISRARVYYGTWGTEPFQALYGGPRGRLATLGSLPEWHLALLALAGASLAALWWAPLLVALPVLAAALVAWVAPGALDAARARFMHERLPRRRKLKMWMLTTFLYLVQPLARLRGRMRTPPWRPVKPPRAAVPRRRTAAVWSEEWRAAEDRLADVERAARADGAPVFCGSTWDRWDLHLRAGLLGGARLRMGLEEHGGGRQLVRMRITPHVPAAAVVIGAALVERHGGGCAVPCLGGRGADRRRVGSARRRGAVGMRGRDGVAGAACRVAGDVRARGVHTDLALYRRLMREVRPYRLHIAAIFIISMLAAPLALLTPVPLAIAVDSVIGSQPLPGFLDGLVPAALTDSKDGILIFVAVMFVSVALLTQLQDLASTVLKTYTGEKLVLNFQSKLFQQSQRLSLAYHDRVGTSDSTYRVQQDAKALQYIAVDSLISLITAFTTLAAMIYVTARIDLQLALVALAVTPPLLLAARHYRPRMRTQSREVKKLESGALSVVQEVLTGLRVVKAFGQEDSEQDRFVDRSGAGMRARIRLRLIEGAYALLVGGIIGSGGSIVLYVGVRGVQQGRITLGELLLVMGYLTQLYAPIKTMARKAGSLQEHLASAERCFALLDEAPEVPEHPAARPLAAGLRSGGVPRRLVRIRPRPAGAGGRLLHGQARDPSRHRGSHRRGQDDTHEPADALLRSALRSDRPGRRRPPRLQAGGPAKPARDRPSGARSLLDHDLREHRLCPPRRHGGRDRGGRGGGQHPRLHRRAAGWVRDAGR